MRETETETERELPHPLHFAALLMTSTAPYHVAPGTASLVSMANDELLAVLPPKTATQRAITDCSGILRRREP